jgi:hypothetical protein
MATYKKKKHPRQKTIPREHKNSRAQYAYGDRILGQYRPTALKTISRIKIVRCILHGMRLFRDADPGTDPAHREKIWHSSN